jgi:hypothetical protein
MKFIGNPAALGSLSAFWLASRTMAVKQAPSELSLNDHEINNSFLGTHDPTRIPPKIKAVIRFQSEKTRK